MRADDLHTLSGAYALNALPEDERATFETHLAVCEACAREVAEFRATTTRLAGAVAEEPPPGLRARLLAEVDETPQERPAPARARGREAQAGARTGRDAKPSDVVVDMATRRRAGWLRRAAVPVAAGLLLVVVALGVVVQRMDDRIASLEAASGQMTEIMAAEDARTVEVAGPDGAVARIVVAPSMGGGLFVASGLPELEGDRVYALWLIADGDPTPAGVFEVADRAKVSRVLTGDVSDADHLGLTVEPRGPMLEPTGRMVLEAALQQA